MKPVIAMPRMENSLLRCYMIYKYRQSLRRAGATVKRFPLRTLDQHMDELLQCDGLLMPGGADIQPHLYGQEVSKKCGKLEPKRDAGEWPMLEAFLKTGKPVLCICRGHQLMNVFRGGTLHQDITHLQKIKHSDFDSRARGCHEVSIVPGTRLHAILGEDRCHVNSIHHQAVDTLAPGLVISAVSDDGIVEGVEDPGHPFFLGVQWHPEHMAGKFEAHHKIFTAFVKACTKGKADA